VFLSFSDASQDCRSRAARDGAFSSEVDAGSREEMKQTKTKRDELAPRQYCTAQHPYSSISMSRNSSKAASSSFACSAPDYWRYGVEELARAARAQNFTLAIVPGEAQRTKGSTPPRPCPSRICAASGSFQHGGVESIASLLDRINGFPRTLHSSASRRARASRPLQSSCRTLAPQSRLSSFLSLFLLATMSRRSALATLFRPRLSAVSIFVASLKTRKRSISSRRNRARKANVIINTTVFRPPRRQWKRADEADCPVLQAILAVRPKRSGKKAPRPERRRSRNDIVLPKWTAMITARSPSRASRISRSRIHAVIHPRRPRRVTLSRSRRR